MKRCIVCDKEYEETSEHFYRNTRNKDGLDNTCKLCRSNRKTIRSRKTSGAFIEGTQFDFPEQYKCLRCAKIGDRPHNIQWSDYLNKIIMGHCLELMVELPSNSIDLIVTDPPYVDSSTKIVGNEKLLSDPYIFEMHRILKEEGALYSFSSCRRYHQFASLYAKHFNVKTPVIWYKRGAGLGDFVGDYVNQAEMVVYATKGKHALRYGKTGNFMDFGRAHAQHHPFQKPTELLVQLIKNSSDEGNIIFDPFAGSGSTLIAAKACNRKYIGCEIDKKWYDSAVTRLLDTMEDSVGLKIKGIDSGDIDG